MKWYKDQKVMYALVAVILSIVLGTVGKAWTPATVDLIISVIVLFGAAVLGTSFTEGKAKLAGLVAKSDNEKPFYKKSKFIYASASSILNIIIGVFGEKISPDITSLIYSVTALGTATITGHSYADSQDMINKGTGKK